MQIYERLFLLLEEKNIKAVDLANHLSISKSVVSNWKTRGTNPPSNYLVGICELLNVSLSYLITGKEQNNHSTFKANEIEMIGLFNSFTKKQQAIILGKFYEYEEFNCSNIQPKVIEKFDREESNIVPLPINIETEYVNIDIYTQKASAGLGKYMLADVECTTKKYELNNITKKADHVIIIDGNSMSPTIKDKQEVFIKEQNTLTNGEIGIFIYNEEVFCKRLYIDYDNKTIILKSDNKDYSDIFVEDENNLKTIGKVLL